MYVTIASVIVNAGTGGQASVILDACIASNTLVAGWLGAIIVNLVLVGLAENEYWDIALRDFNELYREFYTAFHLTAL